MSQERLNIAVFIDFDNIEIGVKSTLGQQFDVGVILDAIKERGEVVTKIAYADWTRAGEYSRSLTQHATKLVQRNLRLTSATPMKMMIIAAASANPKGSR